MGIVKIHVPFAGKEGRPFVAQSLPQKGFILNPFGRLENSYIPESDVLPYSVLIKRQPTVSRIVSLKESTLNMVFKAGEKKLEENIFPCLGDGREI